MQNKAQHKKKYVALFKCNTNIPYLNLLWYSLKKYLITGKNPMIGIIIAWQMK